MCYLLHLQCRLHIPTMLRDIFTFRARWAFSHTSKVSLAVFGVVSVLIVAGSIQDSTNEKARKSIKYCQFMKLLNYSPMDTKLFRKKIHPQCTSISELNWIFLTQTVLSQHFPNYTSLKICTKFHSNFTLRLRVWQGPWFCGFPGG